MNAKKERTKTTSQKAKVYKALVPFAYEHQGENKRGWTDVGVGFTSKDGQGINVELRPGISISGRLVLRPIEPKEGESGGETQPGLMPGRFIHPAGSDADELF